MDSVITTVCTANLKIADVDRHYFKSHTLNLTQQSTETIRKHMMRIVAYIYNANEGLTIRKKHWYFDQPELIEQTFDSKIKLWIDLGEPNLQRVKKACKLSSKVIIYTYNKELNDSWWKTYKSNLSKFKNLTIYHINAKDLERLNDKHISLRCTLFKGYLSLSNGRQTLTVERQRLM